MSSVILSLTLIIAVASKQSFVDTAPLNEGISEKPASAQDSSVKELESLKHPIKNTLGLIKTQSALYTNNNGQKQTHAERNEEINQNGNLLARLNQHIDVDSKDEKPQAKIQTEVDVPSKGIHKSVTEQLPLEYQTLTENVNRRSSETLLEPGNNVDKYNSFTGIQYSPLDMAEYVFWTGDEKGVTLAIEEFLQEGLMTKEEAISFLQEIKYNLDYLKNHYTQLGLNTKDRLRTQETPKYVGKNLISEKPELRNTFNLNQLRQEAAKKRDPEVSHSVSSKVNEAAKSDEDYEELLERLRLADFLYTEYSLEEVIYQLAKVMFTQSLTHGSAEAQQALQKFTNFLEVEAEQGRISRALEKKVLDVLIASLSDTLSEHPEFLAVSRENLSALTNNAENQNLLRQIMEITPEEKASPVLGFKGQEMKTNHVPLGLGKYKNP